MRHGKETRRDRDGRQSRQREGEGEREGRNERESSVESEVFECIIGRSQRRNLLFVQKCGYVHRGLDVNGVTFHFLQFFPFNIYKKHSQTKDKYDSLNYEQHMNTSRLTIEIFGIKNGVRVFVSRTLFIAVLH